MFHLRMISFGWLNRYVSTNLHISAQSRLCVAKSLSLVSFLHVSVLKNFFPAYIITDHDDNDY